EGHNLRVLTQIYFALGNFGEALKNLNECLNFEPYNDLGLILRGIIHYKMENFELH
ncbi:227_t:CDS:1, partial [Dentiscutata heterogama]